MKQLPTLPAHLVTMVDYVTSIGALKHPAEVKIQDIEPYGIEITVRRTFWQRIFTRRSRYRQDILNMIGHRKMIGLQVEVTVI